MLANGHRRRTLPAGRADGLTRRTAPLLVWSVRNLRVDGHDHEHDDHGDARCNPESASGVRMRAVRERRSRRSEQRLGHEGEPVPGDAKSAQAPHDFSIRGSVDRASKAVRSARRGWRWALPSRSADPRMWQMVLDDHSRPVRGSRTPRAFSGARWRTVPLPSSARRRTSTRMLLSDREPARGLAPSPDMRGVRTLAPATIPTRSAQHDYRRSGSPGLHAATNGRRPRARVERHDHSSLVGR